ncbi:uncharacterized protein LOC111245551 [Varroa destructor]|uniref:Uncharacterized protein n=2 Tax=Varroa TaxID=62624 RepID=A0A7M7JC70_VARDE|nr:uncharacterized protein LOC111245551 [Varroa destructor]
MESGLDDFRNARQQLTRVFNGISEEQVEVTSQSSESTLVRSPENRHRDPGGSRVQHTKGGSSFAVETESADDSLLALENGRRSLINTRQTSHEFNRKSFIEAPRVFARSASDSHVINSEMDAKDLNFSHAVISSTPQSKSFQMGYGHPPQFSSTKTSFFPGSVFSPRSRRNIAKFAQVTDGSQVEPVCIGGYLASCTASCSILELRDASWKVPAQNSKFEGLTVGDRLLVEFEGGLSFDGGAGLDILESVVLMESRDESVVVICHEKVTFSLVGGSIAVKIFLVKRSFFERKFHAVSTTGQSGISGLRIACTIRIVQGPPRSKKMSHIMNEIQMTVPRGSRVLIVGENVRERMVLPPNLSLLNLQNLRHSSKVTEEVRDAGRLETEELLRQKHFELLREIDEVVETITTLCNEYSYTLQIQGSKAALNQEMQIVLLRLEALQKLLNEIDHRLAFEVFPDVQLIYGTIKDVIGCVSLIDYLVPAASVIVDADRLSLSELGVVFSVRRNNIYLSIDTPCFWKPIREWKSKGISIKSVRRRNYICDEFLSLLEQFISPQMLSAEFFEGWVLESDNGFGLLLSCFKHTLGPLPQKPPKNVVVIKHTEKGEAAVELETHLMKSMGNLFAMAEEHDYSLYVVNRNGSTVVELCDSPVEKSSSSNALQDIKGAFKPHADTFVSLHGLTTKALPALYELILFSLRRVFLIGNLQQLKKSDENVRRFVNNLLSCGFVRKSLILTCPKHKTDVIFGSNCGNSAVSWQTSCKERCNVRLPCGHQCPQNCHFHDEQTFEDDLPACDQTCGKELPCGHACPLPCGRPCLMRCSVLLAVIGPCGHPNSIPCCQNTEHGLSLLACPNSKCHRHFNDPFSTKNSKSLIQRGSTLFARMFSTS